MIYLISGPTGAGKNSAAEELAKLLDSAAIIDFDAIRNMFTKPHFTPWDGEKGKHQNDLTIELVCHISKTMLEDERTPIILDVVSNEGSNSYRRTLGKDIFCVQLSPTWEVVTERNRVRAKTEGRIRLTDIQLKEVFENQKKFTDYDIIIDNSSQTPSETAKEIVESRQF
ncbi:MAG: ATP-binding protein [Candidatus Berkelbacteria bacterium]|nr:ATP-binding protein [Candidatus Berkelbacteria bacterium]MCR4307518.1 ATP-binding protein [Candidatus Berkelbacteria bacterium]